MAYGAECRHRRRSDALRRRILREQLRILGFDAPQFQHQAIVFGIRNFRIVERVIAKAVAIQQLAQFGCPSGRLSLVLIHDVQLMVSMAWKRATSSRSASARCCESGTPFESCTTPCNVSASSPAV